MSDAPVFEFESTDRFFLGVVICVTLLCAAWMICGTVERVYAPRVYVCPKCQAVQVEDGKKDE